MATIHFILQGKGGVGKSMIAVMLYQAIRHSGRDVIAYDTDPVNATLASFKEFRVTTLDVMKGGNIDACMFDVLLEELVGAPDPSHVIVDNGASSFLAFGRYMEESDVLSTLTEAGHTVFFHSVVAGGQAMGDTLKGLARLATGFPESPLVVWLNPYFGAIVNDGQDFENFQVFEKYGSQFHATIYLPDESNSLTVEDLENLLARRESFEAGINGGSTSIGEKTRLRRYWNKILEAIEAAEILGEKPRAAEEEAGA
mgnify:FL=1